VQLHEGGLEAVGSGGDGNVDAPVGATAKKGSGKMMRAAVRFKEGEYTVGKRLEQHWGKIVGGV
jgi:hypothetical protein